MNEILETLRKMETTLMNKYEAEPESTERMYILGQVNGLQVAIKEIMEKI